MLTYEEIKKNPDVLTYISYADASLEKLGYTEHSFAHVTKVAEVAADILFKLGYPERTVELAKIAGYLHDIGNLVNRVDHSQSGAVIAFRILDKLGMAPEEIAIVVGAIGNHDEGTGVAVDPVAAAIIIADKADVRRSRVRNADFVKFDIHDRVNYSVVDSELLVSRDEKTVTLSLKIDTEISPVSEYFEIFLGRMLMCRRAAESMGLDFGLTINGQSLM